MTELADQTADESTDQPASHAELRLLRETASTLVKTISGPVASIALRTGQCALEITWEHHPTATPVVLPGPTPDPVVPAPVDQPADVDDSVTDVVAPLVGTFYVAPEPGAAPFVAPNDRVGPGTPVGIVEAMKLMNRVTAGCSGEVIEVLVRDGEPVEFGQPLVRIRVGP